MAARSGVIVVPVELNMQDVARELFHSTACLVYAIKTGSPPDFRGKQVPPFLQALMETDVNKLGRMITSDEP